MSQPNSWADGATLERPSPKHSPIWTERKEEISCYLKDTGATRIVSVTVRESDTGILDLKAINTFGEPRENFDSLSTDIGEFFKKGHGDSPYSEYRGFQNELQ